MSGYWIILLGGTAGVVSLLIYAWASALCECRRLRRENTRMQTSIEREAMVQGAAFGMRIDTTLFDASLEKMKAALGAFHDASATQSEALGKRIDAIVSKTQAATAGVTALSQARARKRPATVAGRRK